MARINLQGSDLKNWQEGQKMFAADYKKEREIIVTAINDNYDRIKDLEEVIEVNIPQEKLWEADGTQFEFTLTDGRSFPNVSNLLEVSADGIVLAEGDEFEIVNSTTLRLAQGYIQGSQPVSQGTRIYARWYLPKILSVLTEHINVKDLGAFGNNLTDDTLALQNAIDQATLEGKHVFIPKGTYLFSELKLQSNVTIRGEGRSVTILKHTGSAKAIYNAKTNNGVVFRTVLKDFTLQMNNNTTHGISFNRTTMSILDRVDVSGEGANTIGVFFDEGDVTSAYYNSCYDVSISGVVTTSSVPEMGLGTGFQFEDSANSNRLINCRTNYVKIGVNINTDYTNHILLDGCSFENFNYGVIIKGDICQIISCRFENSNSLWQTQGALTHLIETPEPTEEPNKRKYGAGIVFKKPEARSNIIIGNVITNIFFEHAGYTTNITVLTKEYPSGNMFFNYGRIKATFMELESGMASQLDMRGNVIDTAGSVGVVRNNTLPTPAADSNKIAYTTVSGSSGEGLYIHSGVVPASGAEDTRTWKKVMTTLKQIAPPANDAPNWENGDIVFNSNPTTGAFVGWVKTSSGWKGFGLIS